MTFFPSLLRSLLLMLVLGQSAQASIYMYVDAEGRKGATDRREAVPSGARVTSVIDTDGGANGASGSPRKSGGGQASAKTPTPANFPRIDSGTQKKRDDVRRNILEEELVSERKNLDDARRSLSVAEKPLAGENPASPSYAERVKPLRAAVENHERNIAAIQKELSTSR